MKITIAQGRLIAISGIVGSGKTTFLQRLMADLTKSKQIIVSRSLAVESSKVSLLTLMTALFYDLSPDKVEKVPSMSEKRERHLLELMKKCRSPVALFVDDAHGLHNQTLVSLKRLVELVRNNGDKLSVILAGHPKLKYEAVVKDVDDKIQNTEGIERKGLILSTLMKLKQICNHPAQFLQDGSHFLPTRSHKLSRLAEMVEEAMAEGESILIFSQFTEICAGLEKQLKHSLHCNTYYLHGGTTRKRREKMIAEFQTPETEPSVFILNVCIIIDSVCRHSVWTSLLGIRQ